MKASHQIIPGSSDRLVRHIALRPLCSGGGASAVIPASPLYYNCLNTSCRTEGTPELGGGILRGVIRRRRAQHRQGLEWGDPWADVGSGSLAVWIFWDVFWWCCSVFVQCFRFFLRWFHRIPQLLLKERKNLPSMLTHGTPVCAANLLFILDLYYLPFTGLVFVCVDSEVVYSMFQFFAVVLFFFLYSLCFAFIFSTSDHRGSFLLLFAP